MDLISLEFCITNDEIIIRIVKLSFRLLYPFILEYCVTHINIVLYIRGIRLFIYI